LNTAFENSSFLQRNLEKKEEDDSSVFREKKLARHYGLCALGFHACLLVSDEIDHLMEQKS
jgi:hypothetical protein